MRFSDVNYFILIKKFYQKKNTKCFKIDSIDVETISKDLTDDPVKLNASNNILLKLATKPCDQVVKIINKAWFSASLKLSYILQIGSLSERAIQTVCKNSCLCLLNFWLKL